MALQKINWLQIDSENVPSGSIIDIGAIDGPLHAGYFENLYISGTSLADYIAQNPGGGGSGGSGSITVTDGTNINSNINKLYFLGASITDLGGGQVQIEYPPMTSGTSGTSGTAGTSGSSGSSGTSGSNGSSGTSGSSGSSGTAGTSGQEGHFAKWRYKATTNTSVNPGNNYFAINVGSWGSSVTQIIINDKPLDFNGQSIGAYLDSLQIGGILKVVNYSDSTNYKILQITQVSPFDFGCEIYNVSQIASAGSDPNDGDIFTITPIGLPGALTLSGTTDNGVITLNGTAPYATVENNMTFDGSLLNVTGSVNILGDLTVNGTTTLIKDDNTLNALIVSGAMRIMKTQMRSASLYIENLGTFSDRNQNEIIDLGGF